jgi:glyoxylase-like metal-dependent hydrolase (beta-lactamase superfamily II)
MVWLIRGHGRNILVDTGFYRESNAGVFAEDVLAIVELDKLGRVSLVDGDAKPRLPGITAYTGGKHTFQSQFIGVRTAAGTVILASDNVYLYENLDKRLPITATLDSKSNLQAQDRMKQLASHPKFIVPGHDAQVMARFPNPVPGVAKIQ